MTLKDLPTGENDVSYGYDKGHASLSYDPLGRLIEYDTAATTRFNYDGGHIATELDGSGTVLRRYAYGPGADEPLVWYEGTQGASA